MTLTPEMVEIEPCPFCGGKAHISHEPDYDGFGRFLFVKCGKCRARTGDTFVSNGGECPQTYQEVRDVWNARAQSQRAVAVAELEALRTEVRGQAALKDHYQDWDETERMLSALIDRAGGGA